MRQWNWLGAIAAIVLAAPTGAMAAPTLIFEADTGGTVQSFDLSANLVADTEKAGVYFLSGWSTLQSEFQVTGLTVLFDADPEIVYANSVIDFGAPTTFGFTFQQAIVSTTAPGQVLHSYSGSSTDGGNASLTVTPVAPPAGISTDGDATAEMSVYSVSTNGGTTWLNAGLDLGPLHTQGSGSSTHGPFDEGYIAGPAGSGNYDTMRVDVNFSLSGGNDSYTFNGRAEVIPEPSTFALLALGLLGLGAARRR